jgi:hypothetical protein
MPLRAADDSMTEGSFSSLLTYEMSKKYIRSEKLKVGYFSPEIRADAFLKN